jgi:capsular exopolysaccharide synthesis family protein
VALRAIRRHWWQILAIWAVGSAALGYLAYTRLNPVYDAVAWLNVEPASRSLMATSSAGGDFGSYLDTQVLLVTTPDVLEAAAIDPKVADLPKIRNSADPEIELRKEITVAVPQKNTRLMMVKMSGEDPEEIAAIVTAVVKAYLAKTQAWTADETKAQIAALKILYDQYTEEIDKKRSELRLRTKKLGGNPEMELAKDEGKDGKASGPLNKYRITLDQYRSYQTELARLKIEGFTAEAAVKFLDEEIRTRDGQSSVPTGPMSEEQVEEQIKEEFLNDPQVVQLLDGMKEAEEKIEAARSRIRKQTDPTFKRVKADLEDLKADYQNRWEAMRPRLRKRILASASGKTAVDGAAMSREAEFRAARLNLERIRTQEKLLEKQIKNLDVVAQAANDEMLEVQFAREDLARSEALFNAVKNHKEQLEYEAKNNGSRIWQIGKVKPPRVPSSNNRYKAMAAAPVLMLLLSCGLFVLIEARSGRVADPDELSQRIRVGVIGVVPPLPSLNAPTRALTAKGQRDEKRRVEEFVQSLDQLRVTLCAHRPGASKKRCVLITSATGGEGKTTLAAQLAGRCANAGLMTLLIDADLRRPSLGDLLEVPEGPGLVDVLTGDATPESAMVVIGNAGGFHLLPAGTMGQDPSRLLHGERLGQVIAQFRETFDMVIIDAPPVLAVPDALLLGRWADGAVLAVRHDSSRFPLVERANKRLASVGVAVLGAVVNGCRTMESSYGYSYRYAPYAAAEAPGGEAAGVEE